MGRLSSHNWRFMCGRSLLRILACSKLSLRQTLIIINQVPLKNPRMLPCNNLNRYPSVQFHIHSNITMRHCRMRTRVGRKASLSHEPRPNTPRDKKTLTAPRIFAKFILINTFQPVARTNREG